VTPHAATGPEASLSPSRLRSLLLLLSCCRAARFSSRLRRLASSRLAFATLLGMCQADISATNSPLDTCQPSSTPRRALGNQADMEWCCDESQLL